MKKKMLCLFSIGCFFCLLGLMPKTVDAATIKVKTPEQLQKTLREVQPGDTIVVAKGTYKGKSGTDSSGHKSASFYASQSGTAEQPITIKGEETVWDSVLSSANRTSGYIFYLTGNYWQIENLTFSTGKKGLVMDHANDVQIKNCQILSIGEEGIHLRDGSSNTLIEKTTISDTGLTNPGYGEGIYLGSDVAKWNQFAKDVQNTTIRECVIGPDVRAESIDVKEGVVDTLIDSCTFFGKGIAGKNSADSFIDVKGNNTIITNNLGYQMENKKIVDAFQVHRKVREYGYGTKIYNNELYFDRVDTYIASSYNGLDVEVWNNSRTPEGKEYKGAIHIK